MRSAAKSTHTPVIIALIIIANSCVNLGHSFGGVVGAGGVDVGVGVVGAGVCFDVCVVVNVGVAIDVVGGVGVCVVIDVVGGIGVCMDICLASTSLDFFFHPLSLQH